VRQHARLSFVSGMQGFWFVSLTQSSPSFQLSQRRACRLSPLVPTRIHDHLPRCLCLPTGRTNSTDTLFDAHSAHARSGRCEFLTGACSFVVCKLGSCCVHSSAPQFDRSLREGAPCATLSMLTYYRTSRSLHFPFWAVRSLSGSHIAKVGFRREGPCDGERDRSRK
jgi:hypothetical protein